MGKYDILDKLVARKKTNSQKQFLKLKYKGKKQEEGQKNMNSRRYKRIGKKGHKMRKSKRENGIQKRIEKNLKYDITISVQGQSKVISPKLIF